MIDQLDYGYPLDEFPCQTLGDYIRRSDLDGVVDSAIIGQSENRDPDDWDVDPLCDIHVSRLDMANSISNARARTEAALASGSASSSQEVADTSTTSDGPNNSPS